VICLYLAMGGALGSVSRYGVTLGAARLNLAGFPFATLFVNILGSFLTGLLVASIGGRLETNSWLRPLIQFGFLGAFSAFSAFSLDTLMMFEEGRFTAAVFYLALSVLVCLMACLLGLLIGRTFGF
jgi:CrcB protein